MEAATILFKEERRLAPENALNRGCNFGTTQQSNIHISGHQQPPMPKQEIAQMFDKKFHYQHCAEEGSIWQLPKPNELFHEYYQLEQFQELKQRLNTVKCKLNDYVIEDWSAHTRRKDPAGEIPWRLKNETKAEFVTVAWCKIFECLHKFPLVKRPQLNSLHLCEAPGAFIAALNHYLHSSFEPDQVNWEWLSTTLNPYYEGNPLNKMIIDDRFMLYTLDRWLFHDDFTGNIIDRTNIEHMERQSAERFPDGVHLITADGSIDCVETPDCQEEFVATLHFAELTAALSILADGGAFVIKLFTLFEADTISKMYLLNCVFEEVHVFKPATSKRGNSEVYIICLGYKKQTKYLPETIELMKTKLDAGHNVLPLFSKAHLPTKFLFQHEICARLFMNLQIQAIETNIYAYEIKPRNDARRSHLLRTQVCNDFYARYRVQPIAEERKILYRRQGQIQFGIKTVIYKGSHSEREMLKNTITLEEQLFMLRSNLNDLEKSLCGRYGVLLNEKNAEELPMPSLKVYRGTPFSALQSSLFATVHVLLLRLKLCSLFSSDPMWLTGPKCTLDNSDHEIQLDLSTDDYSQIQQRFLVNVLTAIVEHQPQQLNFTNFPFLTHLSTSVLRYLSLYVYRELSISTEPAFSVTLRNPVVYEGATIEPLRSLRDLLQRDANVLCVVDIMRLHRNTFDRALTEYNNLLLLHNFKFMLNN